MSPQRWRQVRRLFDAAVDLQGEARAELLERDCDGDASLLAEVEFLLRSHDAAGTFIEEPLVRLAEDREPAAAGNPEAGDEEAGLRRIGPYAVERALGEGGMGTVYEAVRADDEYRQRVAIKVLRRELDSEELVRRFRSERQILADLDHPNVARLLDGGTSEDGRPYLVMEYVEGEPLDSYCDARELGVVERLELFRKVCSAVHFAHQALIVHRDLKPGNILVTGSGEPKLLDFGIAKLLRPEGLGGFPHTVVATRPGVTPMTPAYASPEQVRGAAITTASDVYSLGVVLYELLTGRRPHPSDLPEAICEQSPERPSTAVTWAAPDRPVAVASASSPTVTVAARDPRKLRRALAGDLDNIVLMALRKEPQRRYASAAALSQDIERYLTDRPVLARPDTLTYRAGKFVRRHRWGVAVAATAFIALIGFVAALLVQRQQILRQKNRAEEVTRVMVDLFDVSDPDRARGEKVTAREILDQGARQIPERLRDRPALLAELLETIGRVYRKLGLFEEAAPLLEQAVAKRRQVYGSEHPSLAGSLLLQADLWVLTGDYEKAEARYREAVELMKSIRDGDDPAIEQGLSGLARVSQHKGDYEAAERTRREALDMARRLFGDAHQRTASNLNYLGALHRERGENDAAKEAYGKALAIYRGLFGNDHPEVAGLINNLALVHHAEGEYELAEEQFRTALAIQRQLYEPSHSILANTGVNLARLLHDQGRYQEAEERCREVLAIHRRAFGEEHPRVAAALNLLGRIRRALGDLEGAEAHYRDALGIWTRTVGEEHPDVAVALANLALVVKARGEREEAEQLYRDALRISRAVFGDEHERVASILQNLGLLLRERGDLAAAEELYREALALRRRLFGDDHPDVAKATHNLAVLLRHAGNYEAAAGLYRDALRIYRGRLGEGHPNVALVMQNLAAVLVLQGGHDEAESLVRGALEIFAETLPPDHLWPAAARSVLGETLTGQGRYAEAEALLVESYDRLAALQGREGNLAVRTRERLAALYQAWGRPSKAQDMGG